MHDARYRFSLVIPDGWERVDDDQLLQLHLDAVAAIRSTRSAAILSIEVTPLWAGDNSDSVMTEWARMLNVRQLRPGARSMETYSGEQAMAFSAECTLNDIPLAIEARVFARGQHLYGVHVIQAPDAGVDAAAMLANFRLEAGEATRDDLDVRVTSDSGPGWRIDGRTLWDVGRATVVEIPEGWSFIDRWSTRALTHEENVGFASNTSSSLIALNGVPVDPRDIPALDRMADASFEARAGTNASSAPPATLTVEGHDYPIRAGVRDGVDFRLARACVGTVCYLVQATRLEHDRDDVTAVLRQQPSFLRAMTPAERVTWRTRVPSSNDAHLVSDSGTFRGGHFVDVFNGVRLELPTRVEWNIVPAPVHDGGGFTAFALTLPIAVKFDAVTGRTSTDAAAHQAALAPFPNATTLSHTTRRAGAVTIQVSTLRVPSAGGTAVVATAVRGDLVVRITVMGLEHGVETNLAVVRGIVDSLTIARGPIEPIRTVRGRRINDQAGYSLALPESWRREAGAQSMANQFSDRWFDGAHEILVRVHGPGRGPDATRGPGAMIRWVNWSDPAAPHAEQWSSTTLNGAAASTANWTAADGTAMRAWHVVADRTGYVIVVQDRPEDVARAQTFRIER